MAADHPGNGEEAPKRKSRLRRKRGVDKSVDVPTLGYIPPTPDSPAPTLTDPPGEATTAYAQALDRIQAATTAQILLVSEADAGHGATLASLNLGIVATRRGLRTVIIDGDPSGGGPSQYLHTGAGPGLADLASGESDLQESSRLLTIEPDSRLPVIPAGSTEADGEIHAAGLADPIDQISEHSDLIFIVAPAGISDQRAAALGAHADGSLLIVDGRESQRTVAEAVERLASVGAPVTGLIELPRPKRRKRRGTGA